MKLRMKVYSKYWLHTRVQLDYFSRVQLTFTDQTVMELGLISEMVFGFVFCTYMKSSLASEKSCL